MENKLKLIIFPLAQTDLEEILDYIANDLFNPSAAISLIIDFEKAFKKICVFLECCPYINNEYVHDKTLRKLIINKYIVFYRLKNDEIQVIRILYGMRNYVDLL